MCYNGIVDQIRSKNGIINGASCPYTEEQRMDKLQEARNIINEVDAQMARLFVRRMQASETVAEYKKAHGMPILDAAREEEVIRNGAQRVADDRLREYYMDFIRDTMAISRRYQQALLRSGKTADGATEQPVSISVELPHGNSYPVTVQRGALSRAGSYMDLDRKVLVVTDGGVPAAYVQKVAACCKEPVIVTIPRGEGSKNLRELEALCSTMLQNGFTRTDCVVAVGGGVVGDLAGFAAASFLRGIDFYNIPTTVLAQVDSSVGGKVAVDLDGIKNCVGAFYQPKAVLVDPQVLDTLPQRQLANGLAEAVKMAVTFDEELLALLETDDAFSHIDEIIIACLRIKAKVVRRDERETGLRRLLNFGHTIGHGIEAAVGPDALCHGECVALGMLPMCSEALRPRVKALLEKLGLPTACRLDADRVWQAISHDKKLSGDTITVVYGEKAGSAQLRAMTLEDLKQTVYTFLNERA